MVEHMLHIQPTVGVYKVLNMTYIQQIKNNSNNINRATLTRVMCTEQTSFFFIWINQQKLLRTFAADFRCRKNIVAYVELQPPTRGRPRVAAAW